MKKIMLMVSGLLVSTAFVPNLFADTTTCVASKVDNKTYVAEVGGSSTQYCENLTDAFAAATTGDTVKLTGDITFSNGTNYALTSGGKSLFFDLNGHSITSASNYGALYVLGGNTITIVDGSDAKTGKIASTGGPAIVIQNGTAIINEGTFTSSANIQTIQVGMSNANVGKLEVKGGSISNTHANTSDTAAKAIGIFNSSEVIISGGSITSTTYGIGLAEPGQDTSAANKLTVTGGSIIADAFAISGNGSGASNTTINISGGTITSNKTAAIYHPQNGTMNITGGSISGLFGIVARQGEINVTGGTIDATGDADTTAKVGDNETELPVGTALVVDNVAGYGSSAHPAKINVGGDVVVYSTNDPAYSTKEEPTSGSETKSNEIIIDGGDFDKDIPEQFVKTGNSQSESGRVGIVHNVNVQENAKNGAVSVSVQTAVEGEEVTVNATPDKGYELSKIVVTDAEGNEVTVTDGKFVMPTSDVTVSATFVAATNPQTGDNFVTYLVMGFVSMVLVGIGALYLKKN